ncbi:alpha-L-arabinofuranosidase C-terminal domain-containing protein [Kineococcus endophyticus]|uniref:non-reducing end alpha-L-arabinofuranosidase n=1 Tax=Kineococcus endophyticus TaxID=1181883 RepID=A0ABV3P9A7_9ACTN
MTTRTASLSGVVDLDVAGATINRHLYGHFAEHLGRCIYEGFWVGEDSEIQNTDGIREDVVQALKDISIPNLRWPGGCFADEYHWMNGVGPREERPSMVNTHWGDVVEDNSFGTHEFMRLCELLGAAPYVSGNVGSGTVAEMSDWIEYLTRSGDAPMSRLRREHGRSEPWKVPFWGIGNENWGCGGNMTAEQYTQLAAQFATYCRNHDGNELYRIAAGPNRDDYHWTETLMKSISSLGGPARSPKHNGWQALSFHYYTHASDDWQHKGSATEFTAAEYHETMVRAWRIDEIVRGHVRVMDAYDPQAAVGLVCDEWGTWWDVEPGTNPGFLYQQNTLRDALVAGLHFDVFHENARRLVMANIAQTVNVLQAMVLTDGAQMVLTPTYHVFAMNAGHQDATSHPVQVTAADAAYEGEAGSYRTLTTTVSSKDGSALVSLTNLDVDGPATVRLDLRGKGWEIARARVLAAPSVQAHNTAQAPDAVAPASFDGARKDGDTLVVELPPHSFATVELTLA